MSNIVVYTKNWCGYCRAAKNLLQELGQQFQEIDVTTDVVAYKEMVKLAEGRNTVPQIFVDGVGIGGYSDLRQMVSENRFPPSN